MQLISLLRRLSLQKNANNFLTTMLKQYFEKHVNRISQWKIFYTNCEEL